MRVGAPFQPEDLAELDERLLSRADAVVSLREVYAGNRNTDVIQMRHDVDNNDRAFDCALALAEWEAERGYRSTYYLLHTAVKYWGRPHFDAEVRFLAECGHEVGIHADALGWCLQNGGDPHEVLLEALRELRATGVPVRSVVGHGNRLCGRYTFANDEQFIECARTQYGPPRRVVDGPNGNQMRLVPHSLAEYGLDFEAVRLGRAWQLSDSGGVWYAWDETMARFPDPDGQLHFLMHPDWWPEAFD